jgi:histidine triad (HIT) family protein
MKKCIFCEIGEGKREREHVICSDKKHVAFLDLFPIMRGQCMIIPRKHVGGLEAFKITNKDFSSIMVFTKKVARQMKRKLKPKFIFLVIEGTGVDHLHVKLYPVYKVKKMAEKRPIKPFTPYYGYFITRLGPRANQNELRKIVKKMKI